MIKKFVIPAALALFLLNSCASDKTKSEALTEANKVHLESVAIHERIEKEIDKKKKVAVTNGDSALILKLDSLHKLVELWEEGIIEVPGFDHEHHHEGRAHRHEHKAAPQMTDESMLDYQRSTKAAIEQLQKDLNKLKD